jgi:hypothetical protein
VQTHATAAVAAPLFKRGRGDRTHIVAGKAAMISGSRIAPETSSTPQTHAQLLLGRDAMRWVSILSVAAAKLAPLSVSVGAPVQSCVTRHRRMRHQRSGPYQRRKWPLR